ncbi:aspartyl/asparaginyl beta-hydroxylase domain-containing protein [Ramlibacter sp.]|uniref:aspartyl/asparaginyl beta-hydroxylase domain-containing protein n=1 Tax=Ramlibacter sp. TaxID=1917967 RepID=UPI0017909946|nr:aspartyl/asparaginyl beta-hydroxylase domain-containing protein [Ramlibacter sp.]MBA2675060.1 aspartyl/asparaginyl beta-hydroxylase domain-containing protein [Ramlibacter sp.]
MKWLIIAIYAASIAWVHYRGRVRHRWTRQIFDHSAFVAPLNVLIYAFSRVSTRPYPPVEAWPDLKMLEANWETIRDEAEALIALRALKASEKNDDAGFNSFFKEGWKRFYLKWYDVDPGSAARLCPKTVALLRDAPSVKAALFAELPPGSKLNPHRDPFAGSLRYHLGLATPNDDRCRIYVDGEMYSWRDGQGVVFDETYMHWVRNDTDQPRLILLCDLERPMRFRWAQAFNRFLARRVMSAAASPNEAGDRTGFISKLFLVSFYAGQQRRRFKQWNPTVYKLTKLLLVVAVVALVIWA